jgi:hypothetical protein
MPGFTGAAAAAVSAGAAEASGGGVSAHAETMHTKPARVYCGSMRRRIASVIPFVLVFAN